MDLKKLAPWNWFKKEEEENSATVLVQRNDTPVSSELAELHPLMQLHRVMDRLFDSTLRGFGLSPLRSELYTPLTASGLLKPQLDIGASDKEYSITLEVPGVDEKEIKVEITNNTLTIRGEKKQEQEHKDKNFYRVERSYGSFQRVLSLPEDADQSDVKASFKKGVLTIKMPRKELPKPHVKQIEIR